MAMYASTLDPRTGLPAGETPPANTASVVAIVCGVLLCLGPLTGLAAILAGIIGLKRVRDDPNRVGGRGLALIGIGLGVLNLIGSMVATIVGVLYSL